MTPAIEDQLFTSVSTAWRADPAAAEAAQAATLEQLRTLRGRVRIVSQGGTLADDRGSFPVTVRNQLDQPVVVGLAVTTTDPLRPQGQRTRRHDPDRAQEFGDRHTSSSTPSLAVACRSTHSCERMVVPPTATPSPSQSMCVASGRSRWWSSAWP